MRQLLPFPADDVNPYDVYHPDEGTARLLRINMVASVDGRATDPEGGTAGLGGPGDREVFRTLRALADGILVGAGTARTEGYGPHRLRADLAARRRDDGRDGPAAIVVVSATLDLDPESLLFADAATPTIVITHAAAPTERRQRLAKAGHVVVAGDTEVDLASALDHLAEQFGITHVLCEGGPLLNRALLRGHLADELCLTVTPLLTGEPAKGIVEPPVPAAPMTLLGLCEQDGEVYLRYGLRDAHRTDAGAEGR